jgi:phosphatidylserine decarboxylase
MRISIRFDSPGKALVTQLLLALLVGSPAPVGATEAEGVLGDELLTRVVASPCKDSLSYLVSEYRARPIVRESLDLIAAGMMAPPESYHMTNPWRSAGSAELLRKMVETFIDWCTFLPEIDGSAENGLDYIQRFAWFYYHNPAGQRFVQGWSPLDPDERLLTGLKFTRDFSEQRGRFMWSNGSTRQIRQWVEDPRIEIEDFRLQSADAYGSWNQFFARNLIVDEQSQTIPSRPVTMPERDYLVSAPTDCIMNPLVQVLSEQEVVKRRIVENPLQFDTVLDVKGTPITLGSLLQGVPEEIRHRFEGGTGLACILMPNTYHHFHAPVSGKVVHAALVGPTGEGASRADIGTYGYLDWPNWVTQAGNVAQPGTDFSQFQAFQRGVIVIEVEYSGAKPGERLKGWVASIPVGLNTIGSVEIHVKEGQWVKRGYTELGNFYYGGSLDILLFSHGLASPAVQVRMGNQIGILNAGAKPQPRPRPGGRSAR